MAQNPSFLKRQKELARLDWQKEKMEKRRQRNAEKKKEKEGEAPPASAQPGREGGPKV